METHGPAVGGRPAGANIVGAISIAMQAAGLPPADRGRRAALSRMNSLLQVAIQPNGPRENGTSEPGLPIRDRLDAFGNTPVAFAR
ncbi:hypothetical protein D9M73_289010 [compost metagenome]